MTSSSESAELAMAAGTRGAAAPAALPASLQFSRTEIVQQHIFVVILNRPDRLNALHNEVRFVGPPINKVVRLSPVLSPVATVSRLPGTRGAR